MTQGAPSPQDPVSILLIDDRREDLLALEVILEGLGVRLVKASSGTDALRCVLREEFAVILLDVWMPGMHGFEVAELIKKRERSRHIPIIFLTAESKDVESIYRGYEVGAVDYILKPYDRNMVRAKVSVFVELYRRGSEIRRQEERERALMREQMARAAAEASLRRLEFLAEASSLLSRSLDAQGILKGLVDLCTPRLASWCVVDLVDASGAVEQAAFAHEDEALLPLAGDLSQRLPTGPSGALRSGQPQVSEDPRRLAASLGVARAEVVEQLGAEAWVSVPLSARGQVLGAMTLVSARPGHVYGPDDVALAVDLGQRAALAFDNARLYANAQRAVRIRDEFLSIASHELRTPLSALELQAQSVNVQLGRQPVDLGRLQSKAAVMQRQVERLSRLISEMLDVSRIEAGRLELDREDIDLGELVGQVAARMAGEIERAQSMLELDTPEGVVGRWDRLRLDQVVTNLLQNAIKYGHAAPIRIWLRREDGAALLAVEDHGIGISAADQRRIFERFERAVSARQYGGMGVGLFIVDQIVRAHGGRIDVRSAPGQGATFTVRLPLAPGEER